MSRDRYKNLLFRGSSVLSDVPNCHVKVQWQRLWPLPGILMVEDSLAHRSSAQWAFSENDGPRSKLLNSHFVSK